MSWIKKIFLYFVSLNFLQKLFFYFFVIFAVFLLPINIDKFLPGTLSNKETLLFLCMSFLLLFLAVMTIARRFNQIDFLLVIGSIFLSALGGNYFVNKIFFQDGVPIPLQTMAFTPEESLLMASAYLDCVDHTSIRVPYKTLFVFNAPIINCPGISTMDYGNGFNLRTTWRSGLAQNEKPKEIWFFGGSTTYSVYTSDDNTIPSVAARTLEENGIAANVINFGMSGLNHAYELNNLITALREFPSKPDLVIFYDGYNDSVVSMAGGGDSASLALATGMTTSFNSKEKLFYNFNQIISDSSFIYMRAWALLKRKYVLHGNFSIKQSVNHYTTAVELSDSILTGLKIDKMYFLQPMTFTRDVLAGDEKDYLDVWAEPSIKVYENIRAIQQDNVNFFDLSGVFNSPFDDQVYFDRGHLGDKGNLIVGERIAATIMNKLNGILE